MTFYLLNGHVLSWGFLGHGISEWRFKNLVKVRGAGVPFWRSTPVSKRHVVAISWVSVSFLAWLWPRSQSWRQGTLWRLVNCCWLRWPIKWLDPAVGVPSDRRHGPRSWPVRQLLSSVIRSLVDDVLQCKVLLDQVLVLPFHLLKGQGHLGVLTADEFEIAGKLVILIGQPVHLLVQISDAGCVLLHLTLHALKLHAHQVKVLRELQHSISRCVLKTGRYILHGILQWCCLLLGWFHCWLPECLPRGVSPNWRLVVDLAYWGIVDRPQRIFNVEHLLCFKTLSSLLYDIDGVCRLVWIHRIQIFAQQLVSMGSSKPTAVLPSLLQTFISES